MEKDFNDIYDRLTYEMLKMSGGNPYIAQHFVQERNLVRQKQQEKLNGKQR